MQPQSLSAIFFRTLLRCCSFSLVFLKCSPKLSILSKITPSILSLEFTGFGELSIVRCGPNLASWLQFLNSVALDFTAYNLSFLDSSQSC